jgi:hypothetical protein
MKNRTLLLFTTFTTVAATLIWFATGNALIGLGVACAVAPIVVRLVTIAKIKAK